MPDHLLHTCLLCLGSNSDKEQNIEKAIGELNPFFSSLYLSEPMYTDPIGVNSRREPFLNRVGLGETTHSQEEVYAFFKHIEKKLGRDLKKEAVSIIPIDIDLVGWDQKILKPSDFQRDYLQEGLKAILALRTEKGKVPKHILPFRSDGSES